MLFVLLHLGAYAIQDNLLSPRFVGSQLHAAIGIDHAVCEGVLLSALAAGWVVALFLPVLIGLVFHLSNTSSVKKEFFRENEENPLTNVALQKRIRQKRFVFVLGVAFLVMGMGFMVLGLVAIWYVEALISSMSNLGQDEVDLSVGLMKGAPGFVLLVIVLVFAASKFPHPWVKAWKGVMGRIRGVRHGAVIREYENLPSHEKLALVERANRLGLSPEDVEVRRAAVSDYRLREQAAREQAQKMAQDTTASTNPGRSRRL